MSKASKAGLSHGLAAEEVQREGAEECRDALLLVKMEVDHLAESLGKLRFQQLHLGAGGLDGLQERGKTEREEGRAKRRRLIQDCQRCPRTPDLSRTLAMEILPAYRILIKATLSTAMRVLSTVHPI